MQTKSILVVLEAAPYVDQRTAEALDRLLVCAAFEQNVSVLFRGQGIGTLIGKQAPNHGRNVGKMLAALPAYEVESLYADRDDLAAAGIDADQLTPTIRALTKGQIAALIAQHDLVLNDA